MADQHIDYGGLAAALQRVGSELGAAECHGVLCGMLCRAHTPPRKAFVDEILAAPEPGDQPAAETARLLEGLYQSTETGLADPDCVFEPLLPADERPARERTEALVAWCDGFLYGVGLGGENETLGLEPEAREFLADLAEITRLDAEAVTGSEDDEAAYLELVEYLRVGVLLVGEALRGPRSGETVH